MTNDINEQVIRNLQGLYAANVAAQAIFDYLANRSHARKAISIDRLSHIAGLSRGEAVGLARQLQECMCGEFKMGRRGQKSRFVWAYNPISLGKAAIGEDEELVEIDDLEDVDVEMEEDESTTTAPHAHNDRGGLTITQAREALATSLGLPVSSIEIIIRA